MLIFPAKAGIRMHSVICHSCIGIEPPIRINAVSDQVETVEL